MRTIENYARKHKISFIQKTVVSLGKISEHGEQISEENLAENLKLLSKGTIAEGADFVIKSIEDKDKWVLEEIYGV